MQLLMLFTCPEELAIGNIVRRVLHMMREEQQQERLEQAEASSTPGNAANQQQVGWCCSPRQLHSPEVYQCHSYCCLVPGSCMRGTARAPLCRCAAFGAGVDVLECI
eukprot:GHRR01030574.1.p1 GENE.GHRR01030574.1~~GHRR01030574.1.p1  ORF type:complete len:107 (+),score=30.79 GHRR01030574.1:1139-1459(+)